MYPPSHTYSRTGAYTQTNTHTHTTATLGARGSVVAVGNLRWALGDPINANFRSDFSQHKQNGRYDTHRHTHTLKPSLPAHTHSSPLKAYCVSTDNGVQRHTGHGAERLTK